MTAGATDTANQRNAVLAGFLGWTLDAFDFFILTLVIEDLAHAFFPGSPLEEARPRIALATTPTPPDRRAPAEGARPGLPPPSAPPPGRRRRGAVVFGLLADRYGRRLPLML